MSFDRVCRHTALAEWQGMISSIAAEYYDMLRAIHPEPQMIPLDRLCGADRAGRCGGLTSAEAIAAVQMEVLVVVATQ